MSKYGTLETEIKEQKYLIAALAEMGYHPEVHLDGAPLIGYEGHERPERAHIIVRRRELDSASNDIGFAKTADGRYARAAQRVRPGNRIRPEMAESHPPALQGETDDCRSQVEGVRLQGPGSREDGARRENSAPLCGPIGGAMSQKTITITIDESGNSSIDLDGFADNSCSRVFEDFRGGDKVKTERKKNSFYSSKQTEDQVRTGH